ncbi:MAG: 2'-5' RNA ligase family protein [Acidobacteriota bacterium]|nr:2'-5' RNA ligase family protein [Acidobacteriota bacterium]
MNKTDEARNSAAESSPLILTLKLDDATFEFFDLLRKQHFPPERNFIPAHVTLFHALPGARKAQIKCDLRQATEQTKEFNLTFPRLRFLGKGVAAEIESPELNRLRANLSNLWNNFLGAQDRQKGYRPHVTFQNKVAPDAARQLFEQMSDEWQPLAARGEALILWQYLGGPWRLIEEFSFNLFSEL